MIIIERKEWIRAAAEVYLRECAPDLTKQQALALAKALWEVRGKSAFDLLKHIDNSPRARILCPDDPLGAMAGSQLLPGTAHPTGHAHDGGRAAVRSPALGDP